MPTRSRSFRRRFPPSFVGCSRLLDCGPGPEVSDGCGGANIVRFAGRRGIFSWRKLALAMCGARCLAVAGLIWLWAIDPAESDVYPPCALHWLTGLHCPGCGSTRAAHALLHGNFFDALCFNALLVIGGAAGRGRGGLAQLQSRPMELPGGFGPGNVGGAAAVYRVRAISPAFPSTVLAPHRPAEATLERLGDLTGRRPAGSPATARQPSKRRQCGRQ